MRTIKLILGILLVVFGAETASADANSNELISVFESVCLASRGSNDFISNWAQEKKMQDVKGEEARKVYIGSPFGGAAWWTRTDTAFFILAIRSMGDTCAVYSSNADPAAIQNYVDGLPAKVNEKWPSAAVIRDDSMLGAFGTKRGRVIAFGTSETPIVVLVNAITQEKAGGPYQATLQAGFQGK